MGEGFLLTPFLEVQTKYAFQFQPVYPSYSLALICGTTPREATVRAVLQMIRGRLHPQGFAGGSEDEWAERASS